MTTLDKALKLKKKANPFLTRFAVYDGEKASTPIRACPPKWGRRSVRFRCEFFVADLRLLPSKRAGVWSGVDSLGFFQSGVLFDEFFLAVPRKTHGQLDLVARPFATQNQAPPILCVTHVRAWNPIAALRSRRRRTLRAGTWDLGLLTGNVRSAHADRPIAKEIGDRLSVVVGSAFVFRAGLGFAVGGEMAVVSNRGRTSREGQP